jgi:hypothetical protein
LAASAVWSAPPTAKFWLVPNISEPRQLPDKTSGEMVLRKSDRYDPWYTKLGFGLFLCVLVGMLVALYSGVPVVHFLLNR